MSDRNDVVLITGSSGLIGSELIRALAGRYTLIGFDRAGPPHPPPEADCIFVDLTSDESVQNAFTHLRLDYGNQIASVVHLAAYYDFSGAPSRKYEEVTIGGTERLLRELASCDVGQFIFSSTMLVHAHSRPGVKINEDWPIEPRWPYPESKARTEELIRKRRGSIPALMLRIAGVYDDHCHSIPIAQQMVRIYERRITSRLFPGDPAHGQAFVHLDDTVRAIVQAIDARSKLPEELILLIGEPDTMSYEETQNVLARVLHGEEWETRRMSKTLAKAGAWIQNRIGKTFIKPWMIDLADQHYELDLTRARSILDWEPRKRLRFELPRMAAALKRDPSTWYRENGISGPPGRSRAAG